MSAKLLNTELEKQLGCMTGMFHMFDRHCLGRGLSSKNNQREEEYKPSSTHIILEYTSRKSSAEDRRASSSSSSSLDYSKTTSSKTGGTKTRSDIGGGVVKDSVDGELPGRLSVKRDKVVKYRDSPRPTLPADSSPSSSNFLARLGEAPRKNLSEVARFSCDGREMSRTKSTGIRELPRLSLDSRRESSLQSPNQRSPGGVIAKLMGLEAMPPGSESDRETSTTVSTRKKEGDTRSRHASPASKKHSLEQNETVYSQMERRVKELDFHESSKDLRALKHVLGTMQVKGLLETKKSNQTPQIATSTSPRAFESPVVVVKPANSVNRLEELEGLSGLRKLRTASRKQAKVDEAGGLRDTSGEKKRMPATQRSPTPQLAPTSPRVQQRKTEPERKPRTRTPARRQSANNRQQVEPTSPRMKNRLKPSRADKHNQQVTANGDDCSTKLSSQKKYLLIEEDVSTVESTVLPSEQPSPVSVLDASFYYDEPSPSPVKTISSALEDDEMQIYTEDCKIPKSPCEACPEIDSWKLGNIKSLVRRLKQLSSTNDEGQEPVLDYVLEILLASGVQGETALAKAKPEKLRHKLMLDVIREVLVHKLESISPSPRPRGTSLEKEEATTSAEDLLPRSRGWEDFGLEVPGLVLEIERSIFKDLVDEVVTGEFASSNLLTRRRRQLFT
ncbi:protein LONGIFOLIA 1-like [Iris pallida]|uniref:Protein LONGIFOLIA 1-like n=1 Tax=Iris pallida TaxID=29817 RepID=A0AAX6E884_IRIPA|nr:protein LONGIFOLIA 1-like [Iris pallida]